jgi:hypothetical protein
MDVNVSLTEARTQVEDVWKVGAEKNIWNKEVRSDRRLEKTALGGVT